MIEAIKRAAQSLSIYQQWPLLVPLLYRVGQHLVLEPDGVTPIQSLTITAARSLK